MCKRLIFIAALLCGILGAEAQILKVDHQKQFTDSLRREMDNGPYFTLFKDNYFMVGTEIFDAAPSRTNSDVKFQISIAQRLTKSTLPWNTNLFLMYTQKTFWNVFEESLPMYDLNFNPGIGLSKPLFSKDRYIGKLMLLIEHESNGRDGDKSRSWNRITFAGNILVDDWLMVYGKTWIPIIDGMNNKDILDYCGIFQTGFSAYTPNKRFQWAINLVKRRGWNFNFNTTMEFSWLVSSKANQYLFVQYYNGYGECLMDYNKFRSRLRVGIVIKPKFFSDY